MRLNKNLFFLLLISLSGCKSPILDNVIPPKDVYLNEEGNEITRKTFRERLGNEELTEWHFKNKEGARAVQIVKPLYAPLIVNYPAFKRKLEAMTGKEFKYPIFLIGYEYENDLCTGNPKIWNKRTISERKDFTTSQKRKLEKKNPHLIVLYFFEEGIALSNSPNSEKEYFFKDKNNFLRETLFLNPSFCGSFALVKPNGQTLVRNGETSAAYIEQHLKSENWELFFPSSE